MANSNVVKSAENYIPYCKDQGMPNLVGTVLPGCSCYAYTALAPSSGAMTLPYVMANDSYKIVVQNNTAARQVYVATKTSTTFTPTGANASDSLDIWIFGQLKDQLA